MMTVLLATPPPLVIAVLAALLAQDFNELVAGIMAIVNRRRLSCILPQAAGFVPLAAARQFIGSERRLLRAVSPGNCAPTDHISIPQNIPGNA